MCAAFPLMPKTAISVGLLPEGLATLSLLATCLTSFALESCINDRLLKTCIDDDFLATRLTDFYLELASLPFLSCIE